MSEAEIALTVFMVIGFICIIILSVSDDNNKNKINNLLKKVDHLERAVENGKTLLEMKFLRPECEKIAEIIGADYIDLSGNYASNRVYFYKNGNCFSNLEVGDIKSELTKLENLCCKKKGKNEKRK